MIHRHNTVSTDSIFQRGVDESKKQLSLFLMLDTPGFHQTKVLQACLVYFILYNFQGVIIT